MRWDEHTLIAGERRLLAALAAPPEALERFHADTGELLGEAERGGVDHAEVDYLAVTRAALARQADRAGRATRSNAAMRAQIRGVGQRASAAPPCPRAAGHAAGGWAQSRVRLQHARPALDPARGDGRRGHGRAGRRDRALLRARLSQAVAADLPRGHRGAGRRPRAERCLSATGCWRMSWAPSARA